MQIRGWRGNLGPVRARSTGLPEVSGTSSWQYSTQQTWTQNPRVVMDRVWPLLPRVGLDVDRMRRDMGDPRISEILQQDLADARALGVQRTPGFFVNGRPLEPFGMEPLVQLIYDEVQESYPE